MSKFVDALNREWELRITLADGKPLKDIGVDLGAMSANSKGGGLIQVLALDPFRMGDVLGYLTRNQLEAKGVKNADDFAAGFDGEAIDRARKALLAAAVSFYRPKEAKAVMESLPELFDRLDAVACDLLKRAIAGIEVPGGTVTAESMPAS